MSFNYGKQCLLKAWTAVMTGKQIFSHMNREHHKLGIMSTVMFTFHKDTDDFMVARKNCPSHLTWKFRFQRENHKTQYATVSLFHFSLSFSRLFRANTHTRNSFISLLLFQALEIRWSIICTWFVVNSLLDSIAQT